MIDNHRRNFMKLMAFLGLGSVVAAAEPVRLTLKQRKAIFDDKNTHQLNGYYGFGETW